MKRKIEIKKIMPDSDGNRHPVETVTVESPYMIDLLSHVLYELGFVLDAGIGQHSIGIENRGHGGGHYEISEVGFEIKMK